MCLTHDSIADDLSPRAVLRKLFLGFCGLKMSNEAGMEFVGKFATTFHQIACPVMQFTQNVIIAGMPSNLRI